MLSWYRHVIELTEVIPCRDPWDWEVDADYDVDLASPRVTFDGEHAIRPAHGLVSSAGADVRKPVTSAA
jgi:hypothetical protein